MTYNQFIKQAATYLAAFADQSQRSMLEVWKEEIEKAILLLRNKEEKIKYLEERIAVNKKWFGENSERVSTAISNVVDLFEPKVISAIESNDEVVEKLRDLFSKENNWKVEFRFLPSGEIKETTKGSTYSINIEVLYATIFEKQPNDGVTIGIMLNFESVLKLVYLLSKVSELEYVLEQIKEVYMQNNLGYVVKSGRIHLPPGFRLTDKEVALKSERLNPQEVAILFHLLRKKKVLIDLNSEPFAHIVYHLTGHSEQNLRAKGFNLAEGFLKPNEGDKKEKYMYNVRALLKEVVSELDVYIKNAEEKKWIGQ